MNLHEEIALMGDQAVAAAGALALLNSRKKNAILEAMANEIDIWRGYIKEANKKDLDAGREAGLSAAMLDRLELTDKRIDGMIKGLITVVSLENPIGKRISRWIRPNGLVIQKMRVPIGVIGIIYESRPNVTVDAAGLCFKTSNAVILRGGKEAIHSNLAIVEAMVKGGLKKELPENAIQLIQTTEREAVRELVQLKGKVDLIIPRGGEGLIRTVTEMAHIPVIKHYKGVCHLYVDESADLDMALNIAENAKCQRPGVCNAIETLLVHERIAPEFLPRLCERLQSHNVELRGNDRARMIVSTIIEASENDWYEEYLDLILAVRVVKDLAQAVDHINQYGSKHSDAIVASEEKAQKLFVNKVDSAVVYVNASTRFTDGAEFGMGAEIGISTDKLHARGPMGLEELTTYKYVVSGEGQVRV